jgi:hypothetical protein
MSTVSMLEDRPWYRLTSHFFLGLFDFGVLSEAGSDAFRRVLIGIVAVMLTAGLLLVRMYMGKYAALSEIFTRRGPYRLAVIGDDALVIALPMLVVALATLLVSHSLFPDETDFRVLLVLPISRRVVFLSKLLALVLFTGLFIAAAHAAMAPLVVTMSISRWSDHGIVLRLAAYGLASLGASAFAVLALTAINGVLLVCVPRAHLQAASMAFRSSMLCALVLSVPLLAKLPTIGPLVSAGSRPLLLVPPLWFLGVERLLLGDATPYFTRLAQIAVAAFASAAAIAIGTYTYLYRRFDRVVLRPAGGTGGAGRRQAPSRARPDRRPGFAAIRAFTRLTLARSALHQGVFVALAACGAGLVMNSFIGAMNMGRVRSPESEIVNTVLAAPFTLVFVMVLAVRAALVLPIEPRANWMFRMTEDPGTRAEQLAAVVHTVARFGVFWPVVVLLPVQWAVLGSRALIAASIAYLAGLVLVELQMGDWLRIPFTCSYIPGKRFVGHTMLIGLAAFVAFLLFGWALALLAVRRPIGGLVVMAILCAVAYQRGRHRLWVWRGTALVFEDVLPTEVEPLRLSAY